MSNTDGQDATQGKPWYASKTIWGALVAAVSPLVGAALGQSIDPALADAIAGALAAIGGVIALHGRLSASQPIAQKK